MEIQNPNEGRLIADPSNSASSNAGTGYSRTSSTISWIVIVIAVGFVGVLNWRAARSAARTEAVGDIQLLISSRVAVGEARAFAGRTEIVSAIADPLSEHLRSLATDPKSKLQLASVIAELKGSDAALAELDRWSSLMTEPQTKTDLATLRTIYRQGPSAAPLKQREELARHEGWFGNLALSFGQPDSDPLRHQVLELARTTFICTMVFEGCIAFVAFIGLVLLIIAIIFLALGRIHRCYRPAPVRSTAFIESFAIYLGGYVLIGLLARWIAPHSTFLGTVLSIGWIPVAMLWPLLRGISWAGLKGGFGWYTGRGIFHEIGAGLVGYMTGLPIVVLAGIVTLLLTLHSGTSTAHPIIFSDTKGLWPVLELYLLASVFAPLVEETMFRGALFNHLRQWHGWLISALVSSLIFAALHPQGWAAIPVLGSIGFVFAGIREWRGTFIASAAAHAMNNAVAVTVLVIALR
jgi:membrane protease YdiL (CAAX protease family)